MVSWSDCYLQSLLVENLLSVFIFCIYKHNFCWLRMYTRKSENWKVIKQHKFFEFSMPRLPHIIIDHKWKISVKLSNICNSTPCCRPVVASNTKLVNAETSIIYHTEHFTVYTSNNCLVWCEFHKKLITVYTSYWVLLRKAFFKQSF